MKRISSVAVLVLSATLLVAPQAWAQAQSSDQQRCLNALNKAGAKVAATQGKENSGCVKAAGSSNLINPTTDACVAADNKQKVAGAQQKTIDAQASKCESPFPTFGYTSPATINAAAEAAEVSLLSDVFGSPVDSAMIVGGDGAKCQANVTKTFEKLGATRMKAFNGCKKTGLKDGTITNATQLGACIESDTKLKVSAAATKLDEQVVNSCDGVTLATAFPGCSSEAGSNGALSACIERKVECRMCELANAMDNLNIGCDGADDGVVNQTCRQCGNGAAEAPEACDTAGDSASCDVDCTTPSCGDLHVNIPFGDECDAGGETAGCDDDCTLPVCTDGNLNETAGEICDDGNNVNGDGCDNNCTVSACGNGIAAGSEECDDDNEVNGDGCDNNCTFTACGNGIVTAGETCDDDNLADGDGCDSNCTPTSCNNNIVTAGEDCDTGGDSATCDDDCTLPACPDGNENLAAGEQCDDGNNDDDDFCLSSCQLAACGDALLCSDITCTTGPGGGVEECDDGLSNSDVTPDACRTTCATAGCGDNVTDTGETCDTGGNSFTCDGDCTVPACGDGYVNPAFNGETCDTGGESATCDFDCTDAECGDSYVNTIAGEDCDDGNAQSGDGCSATCQSGPGSGETDPQCPNLGELVLFSKASNQVCANNGDCTFPRTCDPSTLRCQTVADLDSGWNGAGHDSDINDQVRATANLICEGPPSPGCGECEVAGVSPEAGNCRCANNVLTKCDEPLANDADDCGGALCECFFGAPFPLAAQGTPVCVSNRFAVDITGTANPDLGSGAIDASLSTRVFLGYTTDMPCPVCGGKCSNDNSGCIFDSDCTMGATCVQDTPGDGNRDGVCVRDPDFHTGDGTACDIDGLNPSFPGIIGDDTPGQGGGGYSIDCQPDVGKNVTGSGLSIVLQQTTGTTSLDFGLDCDAGGPGTELCPCMVCSSDQSAPCDSNADCEALPGSCALATSGGGVTCTEDADCIGVDIGPCNNLGRCTLRTSQTCANDGECQNQNVGPCNLQTCTANGSGENPQPNFCIDDICTDQGGGEGECDAGPSFKYCDALLTADGRGINSCSSDAACQVGNNYGTCTLLDQADCFLDPIVATGDDDPEFPVAGAVFCIPPTSNSGVNDSAGLPGPGRVVSQGAARTFCASDNNVEYNPGGMPACPP